MEAFVIALILAGAVITSAFTFYQSPSDVIQRKAAEAETFAMPRIDPIDYCAHFATLEENAKINDSMSCVIQQLDQAKEAEALWERSSIIEKRMTITYVNKLYHPGYQNIVGYLSESSGKTPRDLQPLEKK